MLPHSLTALEIPIRRIHSADVQAILPLGLTSFNTGSKLPDELVQRMPLASLSSIRPWHLEREQTVRNRVSDALKHP